MRFIMYWVMMNITKEWVIAKGSIEIGYTVVESGYFNNSGAGMYIGRLTHPGAVRKCANFS